MRRDEVEPKPEDLRAGQEVRVLRARETRGVPASVLVVGLQGSLFPEAALEPLVVVAREDREWTVPIRFVRAPRPR